MELIYIPFIVIWLVLLLGLGTWVFLALLVTGGLSLFLAGGMPLDRIGAIIANVSLRYFSSAELSAIPMFIWMGEILFRTDISSRLFRGLSPFVSRLPGGLLHTNILGCTLFAAISGSSAATTATVGKITVRELSLRNYDRKLVIGSLAGAGSLGLLIPPSIAIIVYGIMAEVSVSRLFAAGVFPGLLVAALYSGYVMAVNFPRTAQDDASSGSQYTMRDYLLSAANLLPVFVLMFVVLGAIYSGIATPSEAAAVGVAASIVLVALMGQLTRDVFISSLFGTLRSSCMVTSILLGAAVLSTALGYLHVPEAVANSISEMELSPFALILILSIMYIGFGLLLDGISMIVMSLPITLPLVLHAGFDPVWFGIFLILMVELAQITPPVGMNLFVLQGMTGRPIGWIALAAAPFFLLMCTVVLLITLFPNIVLWLPNLLYN